MNTRYNRALFTCLVSLMIYSCSNTASVEPEPDQEQTAQSQEISVSAADISSIKYVEYVLSDEAEEATASWQKFQQLATQVEALKTGDFSFFIEDKDIIEGFLNDLVNEIPESLNESSIKVRLTALSTSIYKLEGGFRFDKKNKQALLNSIEDLLKAHTNLIFQINKKLEKEGQNIVRPRAN